MKSVYKRFKLIIWAYIGFVCLWILATVFEARLINLLDKKQGLNLGDGFVISWIAALGEDILFFGIIGFLGIVLSTKLPQDEEFDIRIDSIANGKKVGEKGRKYLNHSIKELMNYNDSIKVKFIIKSIDTTNNLAEIYAEYNSVIANMCKDVVYSNLIKAFVKPTCKQNDDYGNVSFLSVEELWNPHNKKILNQGDIFKLDANGYDEKIQFDVPKNGVIIWRFHYTIWQTINGSIDTPDDWYFTQSKGFTEKFSAEIVNRTKFDINYKFRFKDRDKQGDHEKIVENRIIKPKPNGSKEEPEELVKEIQTCNNDKFEVFLTVDVSNVS
jgi:hypothetical protein